MVNFSKQFELQLVPEWKSKYCNYLQLKKNLKEIGLQRKRESSNPIVTVDVGIETAFMYHLANLTRKKILNAGPNVQDLIQIHQSPGMCPDAYVYRTEVMGQLVEDERETAFFASLDVELNKVNHFYSVKEQEYLGRGEALSKQLNSLISMQRSFDDRQQDNSSPRTFLARLWGRSSSQRGSANEKEGSSSFSHRSRRSLELDMITNINSQLVAGMVETLSSDGDPADEEQMLGDREFSLKLGKGVEANVIGPSMKVKMARANSGLTISALTQMLWEEVMNQAKKGARDEGTDENVTRKKIQYAKKMLRTAYVEYYRGLVFLRSFSSLNVLAFAKILKKHDKVTGRQISHTYLNVVEKAQFNSSDKIMKLMDEVEKLFPMYFVTDRKKAMMVLRPLQQKASHSTTFAIGLFTGCSLAFFVAFVMLLHFDGPFARANSLRLQQYMKVAYPTFSMIFLILLHMYMYGWNVYMWRQVRINYSFIFEFSPKTELRNREVLLVCTGLTTIVTGGMLAHLAISTDRTVLFNPDVIPLIIIMGFLFVLFSPFNLMYRSSRLFFLRCMKHIILSPFYKVVMTDFFLADQLTSQIPMFRYAEYVVCYYLGGHVKDHDVAACGGYQFHNLAYLISFLPYWWRLMQCFRRWVDEGDQAHVSNGGKYLSAMIAAGVRLTYIYHPSVWWFTVSVVSSTVATVYQIYWDVIRDWGLIQRRSKNPWLRDELILKQKHIYFISIGLNTLLRFAWLQSIMPLHFDELDRNVTDFLFASLEVIRRGHWNFYRLENEHINNVGKYRAVKIVPLPFQDAYAANN